MKAISILSFIVSVCLLSSSYLMEVTANESEEVEITIWLDEGNESTVRMALAGYTYGKRNSAGTAYEKYFPDVSWNLVEKGNLDAEQFQVELMSALDKDEGPDLIYMDVKNGINLLDMMEDGYLQMLGDVTEYTIGNVEYITGTLEAGQKDDKQYILPISVQCPVVFGMEENLLEAGILREEGYENLQQFLEALISAAEKTGKGIFEDAATVDWIEMYCGQEKENALTGEVDKVKCLLDEVRKYSGDNSDFFAPYETISSGKFLLSGCSLNDKPKMAQNLALFDSDEKMAFLAIPSWNGETTAVITQAVGININSKYPKEAFAVVQSFQSTFANSSYVLKDFPAAGNKEFWDTQISLYSDIMKIDPPVNYQEYVNRISSGSSMNRKFKKLVQDSVTCAVYSIDETKKITNETTESEEKIVITVYFYDHGMGEDSAIYKWLKHTAESFEEEQMEIRLISTGNTTPLADAEYMEKAGVGPDILLSSSGLFHGYNLTDWYTDLTPYMEDDQNYQGVELEGEMKGLAYAVNSNEKIQVFTISESSDYKREAFEFCIRALEDDWYVDMIKEAGLTALCVE